MVATIHDYIVSSLRDDTEFEQYTNHELLLYIFKNYRFKNNQHHGLRLRRVGHDILAKKFKYFKYKNNMPRVSNSALVALDKQMKWPYYISSNLVVFYSEVDAAVFSLSGDISLFSEYT